MPGTLKLSLVALLLGCSSGGGTTDGSGGSGGSGNPPQCGFAACPMDLACEDDPRDSCDPTMGGADCPGRCFSCMGSADCTNGGVRCGSACCNPGEWCDNVFAAAPTCKCANHAACTGGDECASPGPSSLSGCGSICCGVTMGCPR
jgi:hypothetical protein